MKSLETLHVDTDHQKEKYCSGVLISYYSNSIVRRSLISLFVEDLHFLT